MPKKLNFRIHEYRWIRHPSQYTPEPVKSVILKTEKTFLRLPLQESKLCFNLSKQYKCISLQLMDSLSLLIDESMVL